MKVCTFVKIFTAKQFHIYIRYYSNSRECNQFCMRVSTNCKISEFDINYIPVQP